MNETENDSFCVFGRVRRVRRLWRGREWASVCEPGRPVASPVPRVLCLRTFATVNSSFDEFKLSGIHASTIFKLELFGLKVSRETAACPLGAPGTTNMFGSTAKRYRLPRFAIEPKGLINQGTDKDSLDTDKDTL